MISTVSFIDDADKFVAAAGHWGKQSPDLVRHYAQDLGFKYLTASSKEEFEKVYREFIDEEYREKPILFEVFTTTGEEQECLMSLMKANQTLTGSAKKFISAVLGEDVKKVIKKVIH